MANMFTLIAIIVILGFIVYGLGIGGDFFKDIQAVIKEQQEKQKDQADPDLEKTGNFAKDTGTRVCDLRMEFVGIMHDIDPFSIDFININDERFLILGDFDHLVLTDFDNRVIAYQWFCKDTAPPLAILAWELNKSTELSLLSLGLDQTQGEIIRMKFEGTSKENGKLLFDKTGKTFFQASSKLPVGKDFPISFKVPIYLEEVTEDDYDISWKSDDYKVNGKRVSTTFNYELCKPGKTSC